MIPATRAPESAPGERARTHALLAALALVLVTLFAYSPALDGGFVDYDDGAYVTKNPEVAAGLTPAGLRWAFVGSHSANWHPLTWLSHMLDVELFSLEPRGHHAMALGLHALNAVLCLALFSSLGARLGASLVVAALFALHPLRVESVAWIAERKDVLSGAFFFLSLLAYARFARRRTRGAYVLTLAALALGLLAKQMLVSLPFLFLVLDRTVLGRTRERVSALVVEKLPFFALALAAGLATLWAQAAGGAVRTFESLPLGVRLANAAVAYVAYLGKALRPTDLAVFYPHPWLVAPEGFAVLGWRVLASLALLLGLSAVAVRRRTSHPWLLAGWLWYLGTALPVIGVLQVGAQWMADRYAYLPHVGLYAAAVLAPSAALRAPGMRRALVAAGLVLALLCVPLTRAQTRVWRDTGTLFGQALRVTERNYVAHINLGFMLHNQGRIDEAERHYRDALAITPNMPDALTNLGAIELVRGELASARARFERVVASQPDFGNAWMLLGQLEQRERRPGAAIRAYRGALAADPDSVDARVELAATLVSSGAQPALDEALGILRGLAEERPRHAGALRALAAAERAAGNAGEALGLLERVLRDADASEAERAREDLAWLLATAKGGAVRDPTRALELAPGTWRGMRARAAALAATGRSEEAARALVDATGLAPAEEVADLLALRRRILDGEELVE